MDCPCLISCISIRHLVTTRYCGTALNRNRSFFWSVYWRHGTNHYGFIVGWSDSCIRDGSFKYSFSTQIAIITWTRVHSCIIGELFCGPELFIDAYELFVSKFGRGYSSTYDEYTCGISILHQTTLSCDGVAVCGRCIGGILWCSDYCVDWRWAFLGYVVPLVILSFILVLMGIPLSSHQSDTSPQTTQYSIRVSFQAILGNRSALACLLGTMLVGASFQAIFLYASSFFRQRYFISTELASLLVFGGAMCVTLGSVLSGRIVNRVGRKRLVILVGGLQSVCIIAYTTMPSLWFATGARLVGSGMAGVMFSALGSLSFRTITEISWDDDVDSYSHAKYRKRAWCRHRGTCSNPL